MQQLSLSLVAEPVGHSGQIVADCPQHARSFAPRLKMVREQLGPGRQMLKQLAEPGLSSAADLDQPRMAIDALVEERLQLALLLGQLVADGDPRGRAANLLGVQVASG